MTKIVGLDNMTHGQLAEAVRKGARFVYFEYCFSIIVMSFRRTSSIYFIPPGQGAVVKGLPFTAISFVFGWWGIPWGLIYTPGALFTNLSGGKNVTTEVMRSLTGDAALKDAVRAFDTAAPPNPNIRPDAGSPAP